MITFYCSLREQYTALTEEMKKLFADAGISIEKINESCDKVYEACDICASTGRPRHSKKISLTHVN